MRKKVLVFLGASYVSGLEIVTFHQMRGLVERGYEVRCVINGWNDGDYKKRLEGIGVQVYEVKLGWIYIKKPLWTIDSIIHYPKAFLTCRKILKEFKPDICQFCNYGMPFMLYLLIPKGISIYSLHDTYWPNKKHKFIFKILNKKITLFTAVSNHIIHVLENLSIPPQKLRLVYNGIPALRSPVTDNAELINKPVLNFAIIGQVAAWKGFNNLVIAVEKLVSEGLHNFCVQIFGNSTNDFAIELKNIIKAKKLEAYFDWKGFVNDQSLIYSNCAVVLVPSLAYEACNLCIIESMTLGKGLIVSDRGANPELVRHNVDGIVIAAEDANQLSIAMKELIVDRKKIADLSKNAKERAQKNYTYQAMVDTYVSIYNEL